MDSMPINWEALDALIIDFAKSENLIEDSFSSPPSSPSPSSSSSSSVSSSSYHSRLIIRQIRRSLEAGDIDAAVDLLRSHAPFILDDHRLLFRLQKQRFIELLRRGSAEARESAISCLRTALAPCALDAYPEAYEEFKHVLLAFIYDKDDQASPVASEWSERRRFEIAGLVSTVLRAHLHAYDPVFSMTLIYLISVLCSIHKGFCLRQGISSPISDLTTRLLLEERDPPAIPQESLSEAPPFDEVDIQALAHAVELTRQGAVDSLRFAKGDLFQAFQNEICRMRVDVTLLDELVREYCVYRGIVDAGLASSSVVPGMQSPSKSMKVDQSVAGYSLSRDSSHEVEYASKNSDGEVSISTDQRRGSPEKNSDVASMEGIEVDLRYACESTSNQEDCSTSGSHQPENLRVPQRNRTNVSAERSKRKRWRGRQDDLGFIPVVSCNQISKGISSNSLVSDTLSSKEKQASECLVVDVNNVDKYEIVLEMKELASKGMAAEVVEGVNSMDPNFFGQNPLLLFQLKQVEFLKLVSSGDCSSALRVACSHLGPLAASNPSLLKSLKETLLALLQPDEDALRKGFPLHALATSLQVAIGRRLGIDEPQLMKIMRATLHTHNEWFKLQMCKDHFESLLRIDFLKEVNMPSLAAAATSKSNADSCSNGSSQVTISSSTRMVEDGSSLSQVSSRDVDENAVLKVMEFLALPRADAIHLLGQYNGNAETVIQQIFA
ncbi:uncharacterized protein LOC112187727 isoform X3 [Rosa chinensis]|uniref:uncharacterized protein LOC112187727 isoform X3 n=1 Tax=Rosa chinensis TaxID=74649 RepID=UPI001AD92EA9|nr:uncharacterized protein LOC112187727 isoform X3 [Rosa chinensis]